VIDIALARWHFDDFNGERVTEDNLRKASQKLPPWIKNLEWSYLKGESSEYCLVAENTGIAFETRYWGKTIVKFRIIVVEWFGEKREDGGSIPRSLEGLRQVMENSYWIRKKQL
jgi:hypothetical protein